MKLREAQEQRAAIDAKHDAANAEAQAEQDRWRAQVRPSASKPLANALRLTDELNAAVDELSEVLAKVQTSPDTRVFAFGIRNHAISAKGYSGLTHKELSRLQAALTK